MLFRWLLSAVAVALTLPVSAADEPKAEAPAAGSYVKISVPVEIRGVLRQTEKGFFITAHQEGIVDNQGPDLGLRKREVYQGGTRWELDFGKTKDLRKLGEQLKDKQVVVVGSSLLRPVVFQNFRPDNSKPQSTWEVEHRITVNTLKEAGQD
jgi:hypothetical protein